MQRRLDTDAGYGLRIAHGGARVHAVEYRMFAVGDCLDAKDLGRSFHGVAPGHFAERPFIGFLVVQYFPFDDYFRIRRYVDVAGFALHQPDRVIQNSARDGK